MLSTSLGPCIMSLSPVLILPVPVPVDVASFIVLLCPCPLFVPVLALLSHAFILLGCACHPVPVVPVVPFVVAVFVVAMPFVVVVLLVVCCCYCCGLQGGLGWGSHCDIVVVVVNS
jgi:hypothetical protein